MSSPPTYYLKPVQDYALFPIDFEEPLYREGVNPDDLRSSRKYRFDLGTCSFMPEEHEHPNDDEIIQGIMSPTHDVTLPPLAREKAGIPKDASKYAFIHPPPYLADYLSRIGLGLVSNDIEDVQLQLCILSIFGSFIYFDDKMKIVGINILCPFKTDNELKLDGPYLTSDPALREVTKLKRFSLTPLEVSHEAGVREKAWIRPGEKFQSKSVTAENECTHGAFMFCCDNGESFTYVITAGAEETDISREFKRVGNHLGSDMNLLVNSTGMKDKFFFKKFKPDMKQRNTSIMESLLNVAIMEQRPLEDIGKRMKINGEGNLSLPDERGWTALHYACCHMSDNDHLVRMLLEHSPDAVSKPDQFNRFPLHLACDSGKTSINVIKLLLEAAGEIVLEPTLHLERLPLHLACKKGLSREIIAALLHADKDGKCIRRETKSGRCALHIALESKLNDVIEDLLIADTRLNNIDVDFNSDDDDIYQTYHGFTPLHYACLIDTKTDVVRLLLEKDGRNQTIFQTVERDGESSSSLDRLKDGDDTSRNTRRLLAKSVTLCEPSRIRPLHVALVNNSVEISRLILQHEKQASTTKEHRQQMAKSVDEQKRTCLHLACMHNMESEIIRMLLDLDPSRISTSLQDSKGCTPLLRICMHTQSKKETVQMLLDAEIDRSTSIVNASNRNPLSVAILAGAPNNVLELLVKPKYFSMTGMGPDTETELAKRVINSMSLQRALNLTLSQRNVFMLLFFNLLINVIALVGFSMVVDPNYCTENDDACTPRTDNVWYQFGFAVLAFSCAAFCARELAQMLSQKSRYLLDLYNLFDYANIIFLALSLEALHNDEWDNSKRVILILSGISLAIHTLYTLRSIFFSFARFARGTEAILVTLIPFFVTSFIMLQMFTHVFLSYYRGNNCEDKDEDHLCHVCTGTHQKYQKCLHGVFHAFVAGPANTDNTFDVLFGVSIVIVMLNVVIAIVSDAWADAKEHATIMYWKGRVSLLSENHQVMQVFGLVHFRPMENIFKWIDSFELTTVNHYVSWEREYPYNQVKCKAQYDDPFKFKHFTPEIAKIIKKAHSLNSDLHWIRNDRDLDIANESVSALCEVLVAIFKRSRRFLIYFFLLLMGFPTLGATWPLDFRIWILSLGNQEAVIKIHGKGAEHVN